MYVQLDVIQGMIHRVVVLVDGSDIYATRCVTTLCCLQIGSKCREYNKIAEMLRLIPITAENAFGIDYELRTTLSGLENDKVAANIKVSSRSCLFIPID